MSEKVSSFGHECVKCYSLMHLLGDVMIENCPVFHPFSTMTDSYYQFEKVVWEHADAYIITLAIHIDTQLSEQRNLISAIEK